MRFSLLDGVRFACTHFELWFGLVFILAGAGTLSQSDWESVYFWLGPVATVPGHVVSIYATNFSVDDRVVRGFTYRYPAASLEWAGNSFGSDSTLQPGQPAQIEYSLSHPAISRLKGANSAPFGTDGLLLSLAFMGAGLWMARKSVNRVRQLFVIAGDMATTEAVYECTNTKIVYDNEKQYVLLYTYQVYGQPYTLRVETSSSAPRHKQEVVVFQGANPANAILESALPAFIRSRLPTNQV